MNLHLRRIVLFTDNLEAMTAFYRDVIGLKIAGREKGWVDFEAGACNIALHAGKSVVGSRPPKLVFYAADVAATRAALVKRGAKMGRIVSTAHFDMCDGKDPDGNRIELYTGDYISADPDWVPIRWKLNDPQRQTFWGAPTPSSWFNDAMLVRSPRNGKFAGLGLPKIKDRPDHLLSAR